MRNISLITITIILLTACTSHKPALKPHAIFNTDAVLPSENDRIEDIFKRNYKKAKFQRYDGDIKIIDDNRAIFGKRTVEFDNNAVFKSLLSSGVLYHDILFTGDLWVFELEEITFVNYSNTAKRFKFYLTYKKFLNTSLTFSRPCLYFIELTNKNADSHTSIEDFIKGSELTFLKQGWTQI